MAPHVPNRLRFRANDEPHVLPDVILFRAEVVEFLGGLPGRAENPGKKCHRESVSRCRSLISPLSNDKKASQKLVERIPHGQRGNLSPQTYIVASVRLRSPI